MADGQVVFEISADGKKAYASLDDFTRAVEQAGKKWDQSVNGSADNMQKSFTKAFDIERLTFFHLLLASQCESLHNQKPEPLDIIKAISELKERGQNN